MPSPRALASGVLASLLSLTVAAQSLPGDPGPARGITAADFDRDGDLDLVLVFDAGPCRLLRNDGSGAFTHDPADTPSAPIAARAVTAADVDGDGDVDFVVACHREPNQVYRNDGNGAFSPAPPIGSDPDAWSSGVAVWSVGVVMTELQQTKPTILQLPAPERASSTVASS